MRLYFLLVRILAIKYGVKKNYSLSAINMLLKISFKHEALGVPVV